MDVYPSPPLLSACLTSASNAELLPAPSVHAKESPGMVLSSRVDLSLDFPRSEFYTLFFDSLYISPLSLDLTKLVLNFQPAFSEVVRCQFRHTVKWCLMSCVSRRMVLEVFLLYIHCSGLRCVTQPTCRTVVSCKHNNLLWLLSYPPQHQGAWRGQSCSKLYEFKKLVIFSPFPLTLV